LRLSGGRGRRGRRGSGGCGRPPRFVVLVAEKPRAAEKIARALGSAVKCRFRDVPWWIVRREGEVLVVAPSAGHLFGPYSEERGYPVYSYEWRPIFEFERGQRHLRKFYELLRYALQGASLYVNACDFDIEGSVIGYKIIEAFGDLRRARRMKFSSLSPVEIRRAYERLQPLDWEMVEAGTARSEMDWLWGVNISRALMDAARRATGRRLILSAGRVQSPTLVEAARRYRGRLLHVPEPSVSVKLHAVVDGVEVEARPHGWRVESRGEAAGLQRRLRGSTVEVAGGGWERRRLRPPPAFNLGDLQAEAARVLGFGPMKTQRIAEELYLDALISYPRTNSQKLPPTIDYRSIIVELSRHPGSSLAGLAARLLRETGGVLRPVQGPKDDPAHPAIHPTGQPPPPDLDREHAAVYELIVRRFLAAFAGEAVVARGRLLLRDVEGRLWAAEGARVEVEGWLHYYPYAAPRERRLPAAPRGSRWPVERVSFRVEWSGPGEHLQLSRMALVKWMERVNIGTEGTRARIVELLYRRGYLREEAGETVVTELGSTVAGIIEALFPDLATPELTRRFEEMLEDIRRGARGKREVIEETVKTIDRLIAGYRERLPQVEGELAVALGAREPPARCTICRRPAEPPGEGEPPLCSLHREALERLADRLPVIAKVLDAGVEEALEAVASRRGRAGRAVVEAARAALEDEGVARLLTRLLGERQGRA